jgi:adenine-specific DNA methylase
MVSTVSGKEHPRVLIEEWLPAAAIGVECMRERGSASALAPNTFLHVWWARRPLTVSRAALLASLLPAEFSRDVFERLLGFGRPGTEIVSIRQMMDTGARVDGGFGCDRAFKGPIPETESLSAFKAMHDLWGEKIVVMDPMAGGGSIPFESARLGIKTIANEYNPVACTILKASDEYPFLFGEGLFEKVRQWKNIWMKNISARLDKYYPKHSDGLVQAYIFARTVPCPDTGHLTPLVPDWHLLKPKSGTRWAAFPRPDRATGEWPIEILPLEKDVAPPSPTYSRGKGVSLFTGSQIDSDYIKTMAQQGRMGSALYAVAVKRGPGDLIFRPPYKEDLEALEMAEEALERIRPEWERRNVIPTELYPDVTTDPRPRIYGMPKWADMFSPRQLLCFGVLVEELQKLKPEIRKREGEEKGNAVITLLAFGLNKFANWNAILSSWNAPYGTTRSVFDRHDFAFKSTYSEMAPCNAGSGLDWATMNCLEAYRDMCKLPKNPDARPVKIMQGSASDLFTIPDRSVTAVVVDPPYADNVQYSELADFFYVWLKRTVGDIYPEWYMTPLSPNTMEMVVNEARVRAALPALSGGKAKESAYSEYEKQMTASFKEIRRILKDEGVLSVMFTHKKQEAWESLFASLIAAGFIVTATWPIKTESEHSLHQAKKNAAQSTVILVARKRPDNAGTGYFDRTMIEAINYNATEAAKRLEAEGLNPVDQLVGTFGPAMKAFSRYDEVRTDTGERVRVGEAIRIASDAVSAWRVQKLAKRGLEGVEPEGRFALLCWDVLRAAEFRFNEAKLLGNAVGMEIDNLVAAGLVVKSGDNVKILSAGERRRERPLNAQQAEQLLLEGNTGGGRGRRGVSLKIHPQDDSFRTAIDGCHALALAYLEAGGGSAGIGAASALARRQGWREGSAVSRLMDALLKAAPPALWFDRGRQSAGAVYPEFKAWHAMLEPLFAIVPPKWEETTEPQGFLSLEDDEESEEEGTE